MRKKKGFNLRCVCGEQIMVAEGIENIDFSNIISMNETSAYLWNGLGDSEFSVDDMVDLLVEEYEVDTETATIDCKELSRLWLEAGIIE